MIESGNESSILLNPGNLDTVSYLSDISLSKSSLRVASLSLSYMLLHVENVLQYMF